MRINNNIPAMVTQGSLYQVNQALSKSLQKLSTGLRINTAADDAAGLGVSENLRAQVTGMGQALKNTQDAMALLNIADGALNEQANILQRMRELIIQAKNDTYSSTERSYMYSEFRALMSELDRIAKVTNYNKIQLFAAPTNDITVDGDELYVTNTADVPNHMRHGRDVLDTPAEGIFGANEYSSSHHFNMMIGQNYTANDAAAYNNAVVNGASKNSYDSTAENLLTIQIGQMDTNGILNPGPGFQDIYNYVQSFDLHSGFADPQFNAYDFMIDFYVDDNGFASLDGSVQKKYDFLLRLVDGSSLPANMTTDVFGGRSNKTGIRRVNEMRAYIGATINRLEHNVNNLMNQAQNTQAAETLIRDADFAKETSTYTKNQILLQSATAMLSQANMVPQTMLSLLK
jgi:flagellin